MRIRTIKPEFWRSPDVMALSLFERLLWIGLWSMADDHGRGRAYAAEIAADLFLTEYSLNPHGVLTEVSRGLQALSDRAMITLYSCDGRHYFQVNQWNEHQKINRPSKSRFPSLEHPHSLTEDSLNTHGVLTEASRQEQGTGNRDQGTGERSSNDSMMNNSPDSMTDCSQEPPSQSPTRGASASKPPKESAVDQMFLEFWETVPRKTGKQAARKAWAKAIKIATPQAIIEGMRAYREDPNRSDAFTKHPATWLNQGCWEDEPLPPRTESKPTNDLDEFLTRRIHRLEAPLTGEQSPIGENGPNVKLDASDGILDAEIVDEPPEIEPPPDPQDDCPF